MSPVLPRRQLLALKNERKARQFLIAIRTGMDSDRLLGQRLDLFLLILLRGIVTVGSQLWKAVAWGERRKGRSCKKFA